MPLAPEELPVLGFYLIGHAAVGCILNTNAEIETWMSQNGNTDFANPANEDPVIFFNVVNALNPLEISNVFSIRDVPLWVSDLAAKLAAETDIPLSIYPTPAISRCQIKIIISRFISNLANYGLTTSTMTEVLTAFPERSAESGLDTFIELLQLYIADGVILEPTMTRVLVEFDPNPRWQALGLSTAPSEAEIAAVLA